MRPCYVPLFLSRAQEKGDPDHNMGASTSGNEKRKRLERSVSFEPRAGRVSPHHDNERADKLDKLCCRGDTRPARSYLTFKRFGLDHRRMSSVKGMRFLAWMLEGNVVESRTCRCREARSRTARQDLE